jgi:membrane-bound lytic murein transglycosylase D
MTKDTTAQTKHILTVCLTLIFCVMAFIIWMPRQVKDKAAQLLKNSEQTQKVAVVDKDTAVSQELLDYVKTYHEQDFAESDTLDDEDLLMHFAKSDDDFTTKANSILNTRFKQRDSDVAMNEEEFETPELLKENVAFWTHLFGLYDRNHTIFYNSDDVGVVYSVLDFSEVDATAGSVKTIKKQLITEEAKRIKGILKKVAKHVSTAKQNSDNGKITLSLKGFDDEEKRIAKLLLTQLDKKELGEKRILKSFSYRNGYAHRFRKAIKVSGRYMDEMKRIFRERGLPEELTIIPFIESSFKLEAYSRAGAAGIWQFIRATGKRYLHIDEYTDERYDPILATYAAATHLTNEYALFNNWPLTINGYNTGPGRIQKAIKKLKTKDIGVIVKKFKGSGYGFDSRNYYPEFLAALDVYENQEYYFGDLKPEQPEEFVYLALPSPMNIQKLSELSGQPISEVADLNRGFKPEVISGAIQLPKGYLIRVHPTAKENVYLAMQQLFDRVQYATHHVVGTGDSLRRIAKKYDLKAKQLAVHNNLLPNEDLTPGTVIQLPDRHKKDVELTMESNADFVIPDSLQNPIF